MGLEGPPGATGATGVAGATGATGPRGPSATFAFSDPGPVTLPDASTPVAALVLGPGNYVVNAKVQFNWAGDGSATASCELSVTDGGGTVVLDSSAGTLLLPPSATTLPWQGFTSLPSGGSVTLACTAGGMDASNIKLSAIQVETLTPQP